MPWRPTPGLRVTLDYCMLTNSAELTVGQPRVYVQGHILLPTLKDNTIPKAPSTFHSKIATMSQPSPDLPPPDRSEEAISETAASTAAPTEPVLPLSEFPHASTFVRTHVYPAIQVPVRQVAQLRRQLSSVLLRLPRIKNVVPVPVATHIYSNAEEDGGTSSTTTNDATNHRILILQDQKDIVSANHPILQKCLEQHEDCQMTQHTVTTTYEHWTVDQVLRHILPRDTVPEIPSAFETIGHIAHLNLREECRPYKYWIGKVLLDKHEPQIQTVVCKVGHIDTVYRTFAMEVLANRYQDKHNNHPWSRVTVKEEGCVFSFDFAQVYWNSRLAGEHKRLVTLLQTEAQQKQTTSSTTPLIVADVMAGVGPFAIPLTATHRKGRKSFMASNNLVVYANDLNPSSYQYLLQNKETNKCRDDQLYCYNMDGRAFVQHLAKNQIGVDHAILNLPASAPEFLNAFCGFPSRPHIHVHCFAPKTDADTNYQSAVDRCATAMGLSSIDRKEDQVQVHVVRDVAPTKYMLCISFVLPSAVCDMPQIALGNAEEQRESPHKNANLEKEAKRIKVDIK